MARTWILVAESSRAKLYAADSRSGPLSELEGFAHPEGRMHEGDLVSDSSGSDGGSFGQGRHVMDDKTSAKQQENIDFAKYIAHHLEKARNDGSFDKLILVAPPTFLGLLRDHLSEQVMGIVSQQVDKNLVQQSADSVLEHLAKPL
ncbi:host attachment protein [Thiogranum longum]|jgi:protein required for attachment to host cells